MTVVGVIIEELRSLLERGAQGDFCCSDNFWWLCGCGCFAVLFVGTELNVFVAVGRALESACLVGSLRLVDHTNSNVL